MRSQLKILLALILSLAFFICTAYATTLVRYDTDLVQDTDADLIWIDHPFTSLTWTDQTTAAAASTFSGFTDWRLPTKDELLTLVSSTYNPKIDPLFNLGPVRNWTCWTSTAVTSGSILRKSRDKSLAYLVFFGNGKAIYAAKKNHKPALYVRDSSGDNYLIDSTGATLLDSGSNILLGAP